jgi:hypothetical protein
MNDGVKLDRELQYLIKHRRTFARSLYRSNRGCGLVLSTRNNFVALFLRQFSLAFDLSANRFQC